MASRLDELKQRAARQRSEREKAYARNVQEAVESVLSSDSLVMMSVLSNGGAEAIKNKEVKDKIVGEIAGAVTNTITNPVDNFLSITKVRGFTRRRLMVAVAKIYEMYFSDSIPDGDISSVSYEAQLEAVAAKLELEPELWDTLAILKYQERL